MTSNLQDVYSRLEKGTRPVQAYNCKKKNTTKNMKYELHTNIKNCVSVYVVRSLDDLKHKILWGKKICFLTGELNPLTSYEPGLSYIYIWEEVTDMLLEKSLYRPEIFYILFYILYHFHTLNKKCGLCNKGWQLRKRLVIHFIIYFFII